MVLKRAIAKTDTSQVSFMNKKYIVRLTPEEQHHLEELISSGKAAARKLTHARILLKANCEGEQGEWTDPAIHHALDVSLSTIAERIEFHYTPKHGSWLNIAEIELSVLSRQCLDQRIPNKESLEQQVAAWEAQRNTKGSKVDWRFTTVDARIKLKRLYPSIST